MKPWWIQDMAGKTGLDRPLMGANAAFVSDVTMFTEPFPLSRRGKFLRWVKPIRDVEEEPE